MKTVEEKLAAWRDGNLTGKELAEFQRELGGFDLLEDFQAADLQLSALLRTHCSAPQLQNADFFNHQLMQRIEADCASAPQPSRTWASRLFFLSLPRMAWAGAFCLLMAFALFSVTIPGARRSNPTPRQYLSEISNARTEDPSITATAFHSKSENITVLWLDGLNYLPEWEKL